MIPDGNVELYSRVIKGHTIKVSHDVRSENIASGTIHLAVINGGMKGFLWGYFESITPSIIEDHLIRLLGYGSGIAPAEIAEIALEIDGLITKEKDLRIHA